MNSDQLDTIGKSFFASKALHVNPAPLIHLYILYAGAETVSLRLSPPLPPPAAAPATPPLPPDVYRRFVVLRDGTVHERFGGAAELGNNNGAAATL
jgi:hypothetical protein